MIEDKLLRDISKEFKGVWNIEVTSEYIEVFFKPYKVLAVGSIPILQKIINKSYKVNTALVEVKNSFLIVSFCRYNQNGFKRN